MRRLLVTFLLLTVVCTSASAQFRSTRNDVSRQSNTGTVTGPPGYEQANAQADRDTSVAVDSTQGFSVRKLVRGYFGRDTLTPGYMLLGTAIVPGAAQLYNHDWWKVPVIYAGIGAGVYGGIHFNHMYHETGENKYKYLRLASYAAAGAFYWGQMLDGAISFKTSIKAPVPAKATIYSLLLPGLGQAYNGFRWITIMDRNSSETGYIAHDKISASQAEVYRDKYRRWRDYSILATVIVYALNVIDAHVFSYMADFDVSDNMAWLEVQPTVIQPITPLYASFGTGSSPLSNPAVGVNLQLTF